MLGNVAEDTIKYLAGCTVEANVNGLVADGEVGQPLILVTAAADADGYQFKVTIDFVLDLLVSKDR